MTSHTYSEPVALSRMEVVETGSRRRWSDDQKLRILRETTAGGASVRAVARRHAIAPSQIYEWRKKLSAPEAVSQSNGFAAVVVSSDNQVGPWAGRMEVRCRNGRTITVGHDVDVVALAQLVAALER